VITEKKTNSHKYERNIRSTGTHWRSVREGAVNTTPQVPQNCA